MTDNLKEFCRLFYASTYIPISLQDHTGNSTASCPMILKRLDLYTRESINAFHFSKTPDYRITSDFGYLGYIKCSEEDAHIIIGPVYSTPVSAAAIHDFMHEWGITAEYKDDVVTFLENTPQISFIQFLNILAYINLCLNHISIDIRPHFGIQEEGYAQIGRQHSDLVFEGKEKQSFHNTWVIGQKVLMANPNH